MPCKHKPTIDTNIGYPRNPRSNKRTHTHPDQQQTTSPAERFLLNNQDNRLPHKRPLRSTFTRFTQACTTRRCERQRHTDMKSPNRYPKKDPTSRPKNKTGTDVRHVSTSDPVARTKSRHLHPEKTTEVLQTTERERKSRREFLNERGTTRRTQPLQPQPERRKKQERPDPRRRLPIVNYTPTIPLTTRPRKGRETKVHKNLPSYLPADEIPRHIR